MAEPLVIVGGTIAALVAADRAAAGGREVELCLPDGRVGSGFLPLERAGRRLDLGPRIIELGYDEPVGTPPPLESYVAGPHGHRPFLGLIDALVRDLAGGDLEAISGPQIQRGSTRVSDFVLGGDLAELPALLDDAEQAAIGAEAAAIAERLGPAGLVDDTQTLSTMTLAEASVATHGPTFHDLIIAPLAAKATPGGAGTVIASLRRKIWLPLFWPRSLAEACNGSLSYRPDRPMHTIAGGGMGALVQRLRDRLDAHERVEVHTVGAIVSIDRSGARTQLSFSDGGRAESSGVILAVGSDAMFRLVGAEPAERNRGVFVWIDVDRQDAIASPSVLFVIDPAVSAFRISDNTGDHHPDRLTYVCELAPEVADTDAGDVARALLERLGLVRAGASRRSTVVAVLAGPSFAAPSFANQERHLRGLAKLKLAALPADVIGVEAFGADSFNEQVVQGLAAADRWI